MQGDDLSILLFWITLAVTFGYETVKAENTFRRWALGSLALTFLLCGVFWLQIKKVWPPLTEAMASVASSPQSWFVLFIFISAILVFGRPKRKMDDLSPGRPTTIAYAEDADLIIQLARQTSELRGELDAMSTVHHSTTIAAADILNEVRDRLAKVENGPAKVEADPQIARDILLLMHFVIYLSTVLMLDNLLEAVPESLAEWPLGPDGDFSSATEFVDLVRRKLDPGSWRRMDFEGVMRNAEAIAENTLEETPIDQRPSGIDHLALRKWAIARLQCNQAVIFIKRQKREAEENLRNQRTNLLQRYTELNKS
jgi:hypothetical protein